MGCRCLSSRLLLHLPRTMILRPDGTMKHQRHNRLLECSLSVAHVYTWQPAVQPKAVRGRNCPTSKCIERHCTPEWTCLRCNSVVDTAHPLLQNLPTDSERPTCPTHGPHCLALDLREGSCGWACCRGSPRQILPCQTERIPVLTPWPAWCDPCCRPHAQLALRPPLACRRRQIVR